MDIKERLGRLLAEDIYNASPDYFDFTLEDINGWSKYDLYEWLEIRLYWDDDDQEWVEDF